MDLHHQCLHCMDWILPLESPIFEKLILWFIMQIMTPSKGKSWREAPSQLWSTTTSTALSQAEEGLHRKLSLAKTNANLMGSLLLPTLESAEGCEALANHPSIHHIGLCPALQKCCTQTKPHQCTYNLIAHCHFHAIWAKICTINWKVTT